MVHDNTLHRGVIYPGAFKRIEQEKAKAAEVERANPAFHYKIKWIVRYIRGILSTTCKIL